MLATARNTEILQPLRAQYGERLTAFALDVTDEASTARAADEAARLYGGVEVLVNNAGYGHFEVFEQKSSSDFRSEIETNMFGVVNMTRALLPEMRSRKSGHIFNVSSFSKRLGPQSGMPTWPVPLPDRRNTVRQAKSGSALSRRPFMSICPDVCRV